MPLRDKLLRMLGLHDAHEQAAKAAQACALAQRAAAQALSFAQAARDAADSMRLGTGGPATGRRGGLDDDIDTSPLPGR